MCGTGAGKISQTHAGAGWGRFKFCRVGVEKKIKPTLDSSMYQNLKRKFVFLLRACATSASFDSNDCMNLTGMLSHFPYSNSLEVVKLPVMSTIQLSALICCKLWKSVQIPSTIAP